MRSHCEVFGDNYRKDAWTHGAAACEFRVRARARRTNSVAAAADMTFALNEISKEYESQTHNIVKIVYGSSGNFFSQIQNDAPFDVFLSADMEYPGNCKLPVLWNPERYIDMQSGKSRCGVLPL